jgi:hypothetical protein
MTTHYLRAHGGKAEQNGRTWSLRWPDGKTQNNVVFSIQDTYWFPDATQLTLEDERLARLVHEAEAFVEGQPIPCIAGHSIPPTLRGFWSLWKLSLGNTERAHTLVLPLFAHDDGRILQPAARSLWEKLLSELVEIATFLDGADAESAYQQVRLVAEQQTRAQFDLLVQKHNAYLEAEKQKAAYSFQARRRAVERLGLPEVRTYRLKQLASEEEQRYRQLEAAAQIVPVLQPYLLIRVQ